MQHIQFVRFHRIRRKHRILLFVLVSVLILFLCTLNWNHLETNINVHISNYLDIENLEGFERYDAGEPQQAGSLSESMEIFQVQDLKEFEILTSEPEKSWKTSKTTTLPKIGIMMGSKNSQDKININDKSKNSISRNLTKIKKRKKNMAQNFVHFHGLNLHTWDNVCGFAVESLTYFILYPNAPSKRRIINNFESYKTGKDFGQRIFGYIQPNSTNDYNFGISSEGNSELWLSTDATPSNSRRIAFIGSEHVRGTSKSRRFSQFPEQTSMPVHLKKGRRYFIEAIYKQSGHGNWSRVQVAWKTVGEEKFKIIPNRFLFPFVNDSSIKDGIVAKTDYMERKFPLKLGAKDLDFMEFIDFGNALKSCEYRPSYYVRGKLVRYEGARNKNNTHFASVYPPDGTNVTLPLVKDDDIWWTENGVGNDVIDKVEAMNVEEEFIRAFEEKYHDAFRPVRMRSLERAHDPVKGDRYLLDVEVDDLYSGRKYRLNEYIYRSRDKKELCFPREFRWTKQAIVNIIVPLKNSGRWATYLIRNVAEIVSKTRDRKIRLVIIDYESTDVDLQATLKRSSLLPYMYTVVTIPRDTPFRRAQALQLGADAVKENNSILFFCDLHLKIPDNLVEIVRKHCVKGKMAFNPVVLRLRCGNYPKVPFGYWENLGFGLLALFKSDFDRVGGMNVDGFKGWGGEDWELLDRVLESQMEVERLKIPEFYHFYHTSYSNSRVLA